VSFTRRAGFRGRRLPLCAALAVGTVVFRGSIGVLLAIFLLLLIADALVPMPVGTMADADEHFARLVRRRRHDRWLGRLEWLDVLEDQHGWAAVSERHDLGVRTIPIASITGTSETRKARDFDRCFRPSRSCGPRWKPLWLAYGRGEGIPPVSVYRVGDQHVLRDGHHRVSVARHHGADTIEAEVLELRR
jgi:hypothetical protein